MKFFNTIVNFFGLTKLLSNVKNIAIVLFAFYLSGTEFNLLEFLLSIISLSLIFSAIYAFNNISDLDVDLKNNYKKHYVKNVQYFGERSVFLLIFLLIFSGLIIGFFINIYFLFFIIILLIIGFLYSSKYTRFKEKFILDFLFGATLTYFFRFVAAWFIFSISLPPLLPIIILISAKTGGYLLYKQVDKPFLLSLKIKNTITILSNKTLIIISTFFWLITFLSFFLLCLNSKYLNIKILGSLPIKFLILTPFAFPPLIFIYLYIFDKMKTKMRYLRIIGFTYWILVIIVIWKLFL